MTNEMKTSVAIFFGFVSKRPLPPVDRAIIANLEEVSRFDTSRTMLPPVSPNGTKQNMSYNNPQA